MIRTLSMQGDQIAEMDIKLVNIGKTNTWVDVVDPAVQELRAIHEKFGVPLSELQHCLDPDERPRIKAENGLAYIYYRALLPQESKGTIVVTFILAKRFLISIHKQKITAIDELDLNSDVMKTLFKESTEFLLYKMLHALSRETMKIIDTFENELDHVESEVIKRCGEKTLAHVFTLKKKIVYFRRACIANRDVLAIVIKDVPSIKEKGLFAEIEVELMQAMDSMELLRERLTSIVEIYVTNTSNRINNVMKSFAMIATILTFPIFVTGLYGMNVRLPLESHPQAFWIVTGLLLLAMVTTIFFFARKKWL